MKMRIVKKGLGLGKIKKYITSFIILKQILHYFVKKIECFYKQESKL